VVVIVLCKWWKLLEISVDKIFEVCYCNVIGHFWVFLPQSWQFEVDDTFGTLLSSTILVNLGGAIMFSWCDCILSHTTGALLLSPLSLSLGFSLQGSCMTCRLIWYFLCRNQGVSWWYSYIHSLLPVNVLKKFDQYVWWSVAFMGSLSCFYFLSSLLSFCICSLVYC